jgi:hypothetical protein
MSDLGAGRAGCGSLYESVHTKMMTANIPHCTSAPMMDNDRIKGSAD